MNSTYSLAPPSKRRLEKADQALNAAATLWLLVAVLGQWIFAYYVASFYGGSAVQGDFEKWNLILPHGYIAGETMGNVAVALHLLLAVVIMVGGPLQLIPRVRTHARSFHAWNGRLYILTALLISSSGLFMVWTRGAAGGFVGQISISINAFLIMLCAAMALGNALARNFNIYRRWVLRLFLAVNGVWFFRIGLTFWLFINKGPVGFDPETFQGPFLTFLGFAQFLLPLAILELYLLAQDRASAAGRWTMLSGPIMLTVVMALGIFTAFMGMWLPTSNHLVK